MRSVMRDWLAVQLTGAVRLPKARVLYKDGIIKVFDKSGHVATLTGADPVKRKGWRRSWQTMTDQGLLFMEGKCIACGGWARVAAQSKEVLWYG